jgi:hypothetical protein
MRSAAVRISANNTSSSSRLSSAAARRNTGKPHSAEHEQPTPALRGQLVEMAWCGLVVSAAGDVEVQIRHLTIKMVLLVLLIGGVVAGIWHQRHSSWKTPSQLSRAICLRCTSLECACLIVKHSALAP